MWRRSRLIALYLCARAVYCFVPGSETGVFRVLSAVAAVLAISSWRGIRRLAASFGARQALRGYGFLLIWTGLSLAMIRNYSGAGRSGDWAEHFQRTLFFLHHFPIQTPIVGNYALSARSPMMNVLAAFFLAQTADRFELFQIVFVVVNVLAFLQCCLLLRALTPARRRWRVLPLAALFALNPAFIENATYTWIKSLTHGIFCGSCAVALPGRSAQA
jgi:hypothetical protein